MSISFNNSNNLLNIGRKPPKCNKCDKTFEISTDLRNHEKLIHGILKKIIGSDNRTARKNKSNLKGKKHFNLYKEVL